MQRKHTLPICTKYCLRKNQKGLNIKIVSGIAAIATSLGRDATFHPSTPPPSPAGGCLCIEPIYIYVYIGTICKYRIPTVLLNITNFINNYADNLIYLSKTAKLAALIEFFTSFSSIHLLRLGY